jgi:uncharacterized protein (UPF0335 family)
VSTEAEIKQFIERVLRLKEEQDTLGEDIREVYAEAKGRGYDKTVLGNVVSHVRKVEKLGRDTLSEREAIFDLYLTAYETGGRAPASARARENIEEFPLGATDSKLVEAVAKAVQTKAGQAALVTAVEVMIESEEAADISEISQAAQDSVPAFLRQEMNIRPHCQHPGSCAGHGSNHCYACKKQMAEVA